MSTSKESSKQAIEEDNEKAKGKGDEGHCDGPVSDSCICLPLPASVITFFPISKSSDPLLPKQPKATKL